MLVDAETNTVVAGDDPVPFFLDLDDVDDRLTRRNSRAARTRQLLAHAENVVGPLKPFRMGACP